MCDTRVAAYSIDYLLTSKGMWRDARTVMGRLILKFTCHVNGYSNNISSYAGDLLSTITSICEHVVDDVGAAIGGAWGGRRMWTWSLNIGFLQFLAP